MDPDRDSDSGPRSGAAANFARHNKAYVGGGTMEFDPAYPGRWFNSAYLFGPTGDLVLRYRKINGADVQGHATYSTPTGLLDLYVKTECGEKALFPVADTEIGRLALLNCYDINFPEMLRSFALHGAEVILHVTGEPYSPHRDPWEMSRRTRAYENLMYIVSSNHGGYAAQVSGEVFSDSPGLIFQERRDGEIAPLDRSHGGSEIVDFNGKVVGAAPNPGEALALGPIDLLALRERRAEVRDNFLVQCRSELYAREYARHQGTPLNRWLDQPIAHKSEARRETEAVIERYLRDGVYARPADHEQAAPEQDRARALA